MCKKRKNQSLCVRLTRTMRIRYSYSFWSNSFLSDICLHFRFNVSYLAQEDYKSSHNNICKSYISHKRLSCPFNFKQGQMGWFPLDVWVCELWRWLDINAVENGLKPLTTQSKRSLTTWWAIAQLTQLF